MKSPAPGEWRWALLLAAAPLAASAAASPPSPPDAAGFEWVSWVPVDAKVEVGECMPYTDDDRVRVSRDEEGHLLVEHCIIDGGQYVPPADVKVELRGKVARITYLVRDLPPEPMQVVPGCSSTPRLTVWFDPGATVVEAVEVRGFRLTPSGETRSASL